VECSGSYAKGKASWKALLLSGRVEKPWEAPQRSGGGKYCGRFFVKVFFFGVNDTRGVQQMQSNVLRTLGYVWYAGRQAQRGSSNDCYRAMARGIEQIM
jgi:hypothetical protein